MIVNDRYRFVFIHIPKTAGTSVRTALSALPGADEAAVAATKHETVVQFLAAYPQRTGRDVASLDGYRYIAFVRNPWDRFASLHRYLLQEHKETYPQTPASLNEFAALLRDPPAWTGTIRSLRPQVDYLEACEPWIGRFETLDRDFAGLGGLIGATLDLPHLNASLPAEARGGRRSLGFSADNVDLIGSVYGRDVERFGYGYPG